MDFRDVWSRSTPSDKPSRREDEKEVRKPPTVSLVAREPSEMAIEVASINLSTGSIAHMHVRINKWYHFKALNINISVPTYANEDRYERILPLRPSRCGWRDRRIEGDRDRDRIRGDGGGPPAVITAPRTEESRHADHDEGKLAKWMRGRPDRIGIQRRYHWRRWFRYVWLGRI